MKDPLEKMQDLEYIYGRLVALGKLAGCAGGCIQSSTVSSNSYLEPDVQGSSQHRLDFFSVQLIFDCMVSLSSFS